MSDASGTPKALESAAVRFARDAGKLLAGRFQRTLSVEYKSKDKKSDPVTEADHASERLLRESIQREFPGHGILAEEGTLIAPKAGGALWVFDPLDGTTNFLYGLPVYAVSIGVLQDGAPVAAAIYIPWPSPEGSVVFHASRGGGTFRDDEPLRLDPQDRPAKGHIMVLPPFRLKQALRRQPGEPRGLGSIAYELAMVSAGTLQYGVFGGPKVWDVAAGALLVQEAGGQVLVRDRRRRRWAPLARFAVRDGDALSSSPEALKRWSMLTVAGRQGLAAFVAENLRLRPRWRVALARWLRRGGLRAR